MSNLLHGFPGLNKYFLLSWCHESPVPSVGKHCLQKEDCTCRMSQYSPSSLHKPTPPIFVLDRRKCANGTNKKQLKVQILGL